MKEKFSWKKFHRDLDTATAIWLNETPPSSSLEGMRLPGNITLLEFMAYSNLMQKKEQGGKKNED